MPDPYQLAGLRRGTTASLQQTRGHAPKMGSKMVRWAAIEAVSGRRGGTKLRQDFHAICERRGKYKARAAVARKLLTLVYYGLRDKEIPCLAEEAS